MKKIKNAILQGVLMVFLLFTMSGCQNQNRDIQKIDDTRYIVDQQMILILCEDSELGKAYTDAIKALKGNGEAILAAMKQLEDLDQTVSVKNAIGVAYNLLRDTEEAEKYFLEALEEVQNPTDQAILLSNLAEAKYYQKQFVKQYDEAVSVMDQAVEEYRKVNTDLVLAMVLESNQIRLNMMKDYPEPLVKYSLRLKELLKEEKKQFGSNQFIGMFNFQSMSHLCHYDGWDISHSLEYVEKAIELNHQLYQYVIFDIQMYNTIGDLYFVEGNFAESVEYKETCIKLLDEWQSNWHYDRLKLYSKRAQCYYAMGELEKAVDDYNTVLEQSKSDTDLVALSYYNLGQIELKEYKEPEKALDYMLRAYCIWQRYDRKDSLRTMKNAIENIYWHYGYADENSNFGKWFHENIEKTRDKMMAREGAEYEK
ncbi:MAG: tetratricopeptide repeat protein [Lachnospiraceae bacterium]|jgi:tetratricopeptide (TPR) repeat protein|nr:tetratricopeptide repeat protein [Lachnospiraceae bacterium]